MDFENPPTQEPLSEEFIREKVHELQELHQAAAEKYLPEGSPLRAQIDLFYSDDERLYTELSNVFRGMTEDQINEDIRGAVEQLETEGGFLEFVAGKNYSVPGKRDERFPDHRHAA